MYIMNLLILHNAKIPWLRINRSNLVVLFYVYTLDMYSNQKLTNYLFFFRLCIETYEHG